MSVIGIEIKNKIFFEISMMGECIVNLCKKA